LPRRTISHAALGKKLPSVSTMSDARPIVYVIVMVLSLAIQWAIFSHQAPTKPDISVAAATGTVSPPIPPPSAGP
jgi:hypothetical protein